MEKSLRVCKRCLAREMADQEYIHTIQQYVERLDEEIKTPSKEYEKRLNACKACDHLLNGMCRVCGCFVEMRAAVEKNYCPDIEKKW